MVIVVIVYLFAYTPTNTTDHGWSSLPAKSIDFPPPLKNVFFIFFYLHISFLSGIFNELKRILPR